MRSRSVIPPSFDTHMLDWVHIMRAEEYVLITFKLLSSTFLSSFLFCILVSFLHPLLDQGFVFVSQGLKVVGSLMILVVLGVVGVSYYAVVAASYGPELLDGGGKAAGALLVILAFHVLVSLCFPSSLFCFLSLV